LNKAIGQPKNYKKLSRKFLKEGFSLNSAITMNESTENYVLPSSDYDNELQSYVKQYSYPLGTEIDKLRNEEMVAIGDMHLSLGKLQTSLSTYTTALSMMIRVLGEKHIIISTVHSKIASMYNELQNFPLAIKSHEKVLLIVKSCLGENHSLAAKVHETIALIQFKTKSYGLSLQNLKRALEINIDNLGVCHPQVASTLNNLGNLYFTLGKLPIALVKYSSALEIIKHNADDYADSAARILLNIGNICDENGDYEDAIDFFEASIYSSKCGSREKVIIQTCKSNIREMTRIMKVKVQKDGNDIRQPVETVLPTRLNRIKAGPDHSKKTFSFKTSLSDVLPRSFSSVKIHDTQAENHKKYLNLQTDKEALKIDQEIKDQRPKARRLYII